MRFNKLAILGLLLFGVGFMSFRVYNIEQTKNEVLMQVVVQGLNGSHYAPFEINDDFSQRVYDLYLKRIDYNKRYLIQEDIRQLAAYRNKIDDQIRVSNYEFFDLSDDLQEKRIAMIQGFYKEILIQPFDFTVDESLDLYPDELGFARDEKELKERWRKLLKYQVLSRVSTELGIQEKAKEKGEPLEEEKNLEEIEQEARGKVMKMYDDWAKRMDKIDANDRRNIFINTIANSYDPHTGYFPPADKENFDIQMSGKLEGIGATLQEKDGYIQVVRIVPGSASYRQGELEENDYILKVGQGADDPVNIVDMRLDEAVKLIRGKKGSEVRLTVKKVDGSHKVIAIIRDLVILKETFAKSAIIKNEFTDKGIGYIKLPKFYADFSDRKGRRCASDVKKEITKLKAEGIDGLVLDLRNNGGGSLMDVVEMAGLFIEKGPVVQVKGRYGKAQVLDDRDVSVHYGGPLVVLVNSSSASASEIMAAAMQDYHRGVIVGTPTFGKGTVQRFFNLDNFIRGEANEIKPLGAIKLTTQKFYRINGGATQIKGVVPDVLLPDAYSYIERGEREQEYSLPWDEIEPVGYDVWGLNQNDYGRVRSGSRARLDGSVAFQKVEENARRLKKRRDERKRSLNLEMYRKLEKESKAISDAYKKIFVKIDGVEAINLEVDLVEINADSVQQKLNKVWIEGLEKDVYLHEATAILKDINE